MDPVVIAPAALGVAAIVAALGIWLLDQSAARDAPEQGSGDDAVMLASAAQAPPMQVPVTHQPPPVRVPHAPARPPPFPSAEIPTFNVVALGLQGAGKTILLAIMYHELLAPVGGRRFFLDAGREDHDKLMQVYREVCDTSVPWPAGTGPGDTHLFEFDCKTRDTAGGERAVMHFRYLDYSGELLEHRGADPPDPKLEPHIESANSVLVIVDGRRVAQLLRGEPVGEIYFIVWLKRLLELAERALCPVQLVLTKWDLVLPCARPGDAPRVLLQRVVDRLMGFEDIERLVAAHRRRREVVRLIPLSAVGPRFAHLRNDGIVVKRQDGRIEPVDVEVPLCAVLPDAVGCVEGSPVPAVQTGLDDEADRRSIAGESLISAKLLGCPAGGRLRDALDYRVDDEILKLFLEQLVRRRSRGSEPTGGNPVEATQRLRADVVADMDRIVDEFDGRWPDSKPG